MKNKKSYLNVVSDEYYPRIYKDLKKYVTKHINTIYSEGISKFPNINEFEKIIKEVFEKYKKDTYEKFSMGEFIYINYTNNECINLSKDIIRIIAIEVILEHISEFNDYHYYY